MKYSELLKTTDFVNYNWCELAGELLMWVIWGVSVKLHAVFYSGPAK